MSDQFENFANVINNNNVRMTLAQAVKVYEDLDIASLYADKQYYIARADSLSQAAEKLADERDRMSDQLWAAQNTPAHDRQELLVYVLKNDPTAWDYLSSGQRIPAIKRLRVVTNVGLKEALDAYRVASGEVPEVLTDDEALAALRAKLTGN